MASGSEDPGDKDIPTFVIHGLQALLALDVPQPDGFVVRAREQEAAVCGDRQTGHLVPGMGKRMFKLRMTPGLPEAGEVGRWGQMVAGRYVWFLTCAL